MKAGRFINAEHPEQEIIFTRNTTESINLVANAWGRKFLKPGDEIVFSAMEHHSNLVPWQLIALATGAKLRFIDIDDDGKLIWDDVLAKIGDRRRRSSPSRRCRTCSARSTRSSEIAEVAHRFGAVVLVDGAQSVPHMPVDVQRPGLRLPGVLVAQDARPDRRRRALRQARPARGDGPVPRRRRDDQARDVRVEHLRRPAAQVRGRHAEHRRRHRLRRRRSTISKASAWTPCASTRSTSRSTPSTSSARSRA